ncbi:YjbH domain-containing protein [Paraburkholderia sp. RL17-337-BIB-A]|uniref:YjbH domain-containing protein n=1 Tax=Paraburkholderia sp. RL17-337-BIB-A TaxID=3031636 RepID=UPI0038BAD943
MHKKKQRDQHRLIREVHVLGVALAFSTSAYAVDPALSSLGQSGGLTIPSAFVLPQGTFDAQGNDYIDPRYGKAATSSQVYWAGIGLFPYVEISGGLANYPADTHVQFAGEEHFVLRHLMANAKVQIPIFFKYQPSIAFGITDIGGQTHYFRSKYGVVSQAFGPLALSAGYGQGDRLNGAFGGAELSLWNTGLSVLAEDDSKTPYAGLRYRSPSIPWLANASVVGTLVRSLKVTDGAAPRTSFTVAVQIPFGQRFTAANCTDGLCTNTPPAIGAPPTSYTAPAKVSDAPPSSGWANPVPDSKSGSFQYAPATRSFTASSDDKFAPDAVMARTLSVASDPAMLDELVRILTSAGLERVRAGMVGDDLVVEYENHRYNQNEADALGIVLGAATAEAPSSVGQLRVVIKKANQPIGEVSVSRAAYAEFLRNGEQGPVDTSLTMRTRPTYDSDEVAWHGDEHKHGLVRVRVQPVTNYLFGTEYGNFDYSVGASFETFVPLWRGAEFYTNTIAPLFNSQNLNNGRVFSQYRLRGGLTTAALAQSFWIAPQVFNVTAVGKFEHDYLGVENETTAFVPGRPDVVRLQLAYLRREPGQDALPDVKTAMLTYRWVQPSWNLWVEGGAARYVGGDKGPLLTVTRWFDDVSVSIHGEHSGHGSFLGAAISFPLTPRQGMKPNLVQLAGATQFTQDIRTRVGSTNYIAGDAAQTLGFGYSTQQDLLNRGRFSAGYFATQLYRMRDAYLRYVVPGARPSSAQTSP